MGHAPFVQCSVRFSEPTTHPQSPYVICLWSQKATWPHLQRKLPARTYALTADRTADRTADKPSTACVSLESVDVFFIPVILLRAFFTSAGKFTEDRPTVALRLARLQYSGCEKEKNRFYSGRMTAQSQRHCDASQSLCRSAFVDRFTQNLSRKEKHQKRYHPKIFWKIKKKYKIKKFRKKILKKF